MSGGLCTVPHAGSGRLKDQFGVRYAQKSISGAACYLTVFDDTEDEKPARNDRNVQWPEGASATVGRARFGLDEYMRHHVRVRYRRRRRSEEDERAGR